ncbi:alcohol dehydrogenase [Paecilomyces variotii No. 5]|uniref:Alcohol dehydrogenase n=1 Tax=Byssochlamys spectabilis (strain No. 5 / NBRC 109023) TaxID=1356009 RepID=V5FN23_BYSSN|nr:alcohol dehydrogenase [Paecilomyces variotii No. 5]
MASEQSEDVGLEERLKSALWLSIGKIVDEETIKLGVNATPQFIGALTEMVWAQIDGAREYSSDCQTDSDDSTETVSQDLESFAKHAGRSTINVADVMLLTRRNEGLESILRAFVDQQPLVLYEWLDRANFGYFGGIHHHAPSAKDFAQCFTGIKSVNFSDLTELWSLFHDPSCCPTFFTMTTSGSITSAHTSARMPPTKSDSYITKLKSPQTMRSVRFHGRGDIRVDTIEEPMCGKGQVKLRPAFVGICGSDLHEYSGGPVLTPGKPHGITGRSLPVSIGHEFAGIVEEVGEGVTHVSPGQKAVVKPTIFDGTCASCKLGYEYCCENIGFIGLSGRGGGMSEHIVAPGGHFYALPDDISLESAALIEPLAVAWHAVNLSPFKMGDSVFIIGGGPIGIGIVQVLKLQGAKHIIVAEVTDSRKAFAQEFGATHVLDPREVDVPSKVKELTDDIGADVVFDAAGVEGALNSAIPACRTHGTIVNVAVWEKRPHLDVNELMYKEIKYTGAALYDESAFTNVIQAFCYGQLKPEKMITAKVKLDEVDEKGFQALLKDRDHHCKIVVDVQG